MKFVVIGGGIIGTSIARELARRKAGRVLVLEKEPEPGRHASGRNSGVIHSGINQKPGSIKARMCLDGSRRLREYCRLKGVPMNECGTLVAARNEAEEATLARLLDMGKACGVEGLRLLTAREFNEREPQGTATSALLSPTGATVDSLALLKAVIADAKADGVDYRLTREVTAVEDRTLATREGKLDADYIVNCAGLYADKIGHRMGVGLEYRIIPFRGEYMEVHGCDVKTMIYQPPDLRFPFLSIHLTRETDGRVLAGPSAVLALGREAYDKEIDLKELAGMALSRNFWSMVASRPFLQIAVENAKTSLSRKAFYEQVRALAPGVKLADLSPARAGIRAQMVDRQGRMVDDIMVKYMDSSAHVLNAVSPGMTCSFAFAEYVVDGILKKH